MIRRGLTLIEVLAATVLLSMIAAAVVPTMVRSAVMLQHQVPTDSFDLARLADDFVADPQAFGFKDTAWLSTVDSFGLQWPASTEFQAAGTGAIQVTMLRCSSADTDHLWLVFQSDQHIATRWLPPTPTHTHPHSPLPHPHSLPPKSSTGTHSSASHE